MVDLEHAADVVESRLARLGRPRMILALFASTSKRPRSRSMRDALRAIIAWSVTSSAIGRASMASPRSVSTARAPCPSSRAPTSTVISRWPSWWAISRPIPLFAPVMSAVRLPARAVPDHVLPSRFAPRRHGGAVPERRASVHVRDGSLRQRAAPPRPVRVVALRRALVEQRRFQVVLFDARLVDEARATLDYTASAPRKTRSVRTIRASYRWRRCIACCFATTHLPRSSRVRPATRCGLFASSRRSIENRPVPVARGPSR